MGGLNGYADIDSFRRIPLALDFSVYTLQRVALAGRVSDPSDGVRITMSTRDLLCSFF